MTQNSKDASCPKDIMKSYSPSASVSLPNKTSEKEFCF